VSQSSREITILDQILTSFDTLFGKKYNTFVMGGAEEPLYQPSDTANSRNIIYFSHDYVASALHEIHAPL